MPYWEGGNSHPWRYEDDGLTSLKNELFKNEGGNNLMNNAVRHFCMERAVDAGEEAARTVSDNNQVAIGQVDVQQIDSMLAQAGGHGPLSSTQSLSVATSDWSGGVCENPFEDGAAGTSESRYTHSACPALFANKKSDASKLCTFWHEAYLNQVEELYVEAHDVSKTQDQKNVARYRYRKLIQDYDNSIQNWCGEHPDSPYCRCAPLAEAESNTADSQAGDAHPEGVTWLQNWPEYKIPNCKCFTT